MNWVECGVVLIVAALSTIALTPVAKRIAIRVDAIDYPDKRRVNKEPIPRMGGVAIFSGIVISCIVILIGANFFDWLNPFHSYNDMEINFVVLAIGVIIMFVVGLVDDIYNLPARSKFTGQIVSACIVAGSGLLLTDIQNPFQAGAFIEFHAFSYPITVFYLVAFANIINLIDGLDGLASGISAISAGTICTFAILSGRFESAILSIIIVGVCLGFLRFNHHPASIFMGDSGALTLGLCLGIVSLLAIARSTLFITLLVPILAAGVPVIDTALAIVRRKLANQPIDAPDKGHIHHRLLRAGFTQQATVYIMWAWTAALAICGIVLAETTGVPRFVAIVMAALITGFAVVKLRLLEPVLRHHYNPRKKKRRKRNDPPIEEPQDLPAEPQDYDE